MLPTVIDVPPVPIGDLDTTVRLLSEIIGQPADDVAQHLHREECHLGAHVSDELQTRRIPAHEWSDQLVEFYERSNAFLYESFVYNSTDTKQSLRRWIAQFLAKDQKEPQRVLLYGDGLGFDAAYLAHCGHKATYFEIGQPCVQFARRVFELNNVNVEVFDRPQTLPNEVFDVVICLDVLEHVRDPRILVRELAAHLRPGGRLIVHAPFWYIHPDVQTHLRTNVRFCGDWRMLYEPAGLRPVDAAFLWCPIVLAKDDYAKPMTLGARLRIVTSSWILKCSLLSTIPLVTVAKLFFAPKSARAR